jgi:flagellar assembly protein FliH
MSSLPLTRRGRPGGFEPDARFLTLVSAQPAVPEPAAPQPDPLVDAYERGLRDGAALAADEARRSESEREAARQAIELAFGRLDEEDAVALRERLRQTVLALCEAAVVPLAIDPAGLAARVERAVGMLQRAQDERVVRLHPDDLALVRDRLPGALRIEPDAKVERGGLRIETSDGGVEDGPSHWRRYLAEAFREC